MLPAGRNKHLKAFHGSHGHSKILIINFAQACIAKNEEPCASTQRSSSVQIGQEILPAKNFEPVVWGRLAQQHLVEKLSGMSEVVTLKEKIHMNITILDWYPFTMIQYREYATSRI